MKKQSLILLLCAATSISFGQLKIRTDGSTWTGYSGYSNIYMGSSPGTGQYSTYDYGKWGIEVWGENLNFWKPWPSQNSGNYFMFLTPAGAIGIGKNPTHSGICLDVNGKVYSYGIELTSDERLKENIQSLEGKIDKIYKLNGKSYKKKSIEDELALPDIVDSKGNIIKKYEKSSNKKSVQIEEFGFLAQELKDVYPQLVSQDTLGYYFVNYIGLIPVLVEALKEQKLQIDLLTAKVNGKSSSGPLKVGSSSSAADNKTDLLTYPVLEQNTPNPFNTSTNIEYYLPTTIMNASIYVYDMNGVQIQSYSIQPRGKGNITIQGSEFNAGMYLYALIADGKVIDTKRMILTK